MDFSYTEVQQMLQDSVKKFVVKNYDFDTRSKIIDSDSGYSEENWKLFAELGWLTVPFSEEDEPNPKDNYGVSKYEAEKLLMGISKQAGMEIVIIRPPLVYGPGVKANFLRLIKLVDTRIPLPFLFVKNKRSYISIDNLIDFIILCIKHPRAANETFLISDGENLSTRSLVNLISQSLGKHSLLLPLPVWAMKFFGKLFGKKKEIDKLCDSLEVDISKAINLLSWVPKEDISRSIKEAVKYYQEN